MTIDFSQWKLVPVVATPEMFFAFFNHGSYDAGNGYTAMLAASPSPPVDVAGLVAERDNLRDMYDTFTEVAHGALANMTARAEAAEQESARLREALERIAGLSMSQFSRVQNLADTAIQIAAAALTHQDPKK